MRCNLAEFGVFFKQALGIHRWNTIWSWWWGPLTPLQRNSLQSSSIIMCGGHISCEAAEQRQASNSIRVFFQIMKIRLTKCGNVIFFLSLKFHVKSIVVHKKLPIRCKLGIWWIDTNFQVWILLVYKFRASNYSQIAVLWDSLHEEGNITRQNHHQYPKNMPFLLYLDDLYVVGKKFVILQQNIRAH